MELVALVAVCAVIVGALVFVLLVLPSDRPMRRLTEALVAIFGGRR